MAENLGIRIQAKIDKSESIKDINKSLKQMQSSLNSLDINVDFKGLQQDFNKAMKQFDTKSMEKKIEKSVNSSLDTVRKKNKELSDKISSVVGDYGGSVAGIQTNYGKDQNDLKGALITLKDYNSELTRKVRINKEMSGFEVVDVQEIENIEKARKEQEKLTREQEKAYQDKVKELRRTEQQTEKQIRKEKDFSSKYKQWWHNALEAKEAREEKQRERELRYREQVQNNLRERKRKEKEVTEEMQHQLEKQQRLAKVKVNKLLTEKSKYITEDDRKSLDNYLKSMNNLTSNTPNLKRRIDALQTSFKETKGQIDQTAAKTMGLGERFREAATSIPIWMAGMTAFFLPLRGLQDATAQIIEIDRQMTELKRVMDATPSQFNEMLGESIALADELGSTVQDTNEIMTNFARMGYDQDQIMDLTRVSTLMQNISEVNADDAASSLIAAMKGFKIEAEDAISVVDKLNEVDKLLSLISVTVLANSSNSGKPKWFNHMAILSEVLFLKRENVQRLAFIA